MADRFEPNLACYYSIASVLDNVRSITNNTIATDFDMNSLNSFHTFFNILYCLTSILALIGNVGVLIVQVCCYRSPPVQNFKKYLINLALSDTLFGALCVPFMYTDFTLGQWIFPHWLCPTAQYVQLLSVCVNSSTLIIISIERYCATLYPFSEFLRVLKSYSYLLIAATWIFGIAYTYIPTRYSAVEKIEPSNSTYHYQCKNYTGVSASDRRVLVVANFVVIFVIPALVITATYTAIVRNHIKRGQALTENEYNSVGYKFSTKKQPVKSVPFATSLSVTNRMIRENAKAIRITLTIIILYGICWLPVKVFILLYEFSLITSSTVQQYFYQQYLYIGLHWLAMAHSFVNPIVYTFSSQRFRDDLRNMFN